MVSNPSVNQRYTGATILRASSCKPRSHNTRALLTHARSSRKREFCRRATLIAHRSQRFTLFATGLGGLGLLGWSRKRKAQAVFLCHQPPGKHPQGNIPRETSAAV